MPHNAGDAAKAYRLRKRKDQLGPVDRLWLAEYEEKQEQDRERKRDAKDVGASRSGRRIKLDVEEHAEAMGTGTAAAAAASAALVAKEEGRRLDSLTINAVDALKEACAVYKDICLSLRERAEVLEATHVAMLEGVREHFAARTEAEMALVQQEQSGDPAKDLLIMMIAKKLGIPVDYIPPGAGGPSRRRPPANGAAKS
jgi:hypothetical protein